MGDRMVCPDCGSSSYLVVDGKEMSEYDLLHLRRAPRKIERRLPHAVWCTSDQNRMSLLHHALTDSTEQGANPEPSHRDIGPDAPPSPTARSNA